MWLIKGPILVLTLVIWSVVGLVFWIPLLARSTAVFSAGILLAALARRDARAYGRQLEAAISFYPDGFRKTIDALTAESLEDREADYLSVPIGRFIGESLWAALFWLGVLFALENLGLGPGLLHEAVGRLRSRLGV